MAQLIFPEQFDSFERAVALGTKNSLSDQEVQELIDTPIPVYEEGVEEVATKRRDDLNTDAGTYWERTVTMSDGQRHSELVGISKNRHADALVASIPAWWTRLDGGLNKITSDAFHRRGMHTYIKGVAENRFASLSRGAHDMHVVLDTDGDGFGYHFDAASIYFHGDSNGAMQGTGVLVYAPQHDRKVIDAFLVDPCVARRVEGDDIKKFVTHPTYLPKEVRSIARHVMDMVRHPDMAIEECARTVESNPARILGNIMLTRALFSGEFGLLLAHLPPEQHVHYPLFEHSMANQKRRMIQILGAIDTKATHDVRPGTHTSIADPQILEEKVEYIVPGPELAVVA